MERIRRAAAAGIFYPAEPGKLRSMVRGFLSRAESRPGNPAALIVPHAGYVYSGPVAASAYAALSKRDSPIQRVVLIGPSHYVPLDGIAVPAAREFETPLGPVPVDIHTLKTLLVRPGVRVDDEVHRREHSLEVQLPFLMEVLPAFRLIPLATGFTRAADVAVILDSLWEDESTLIVASSDLSHYQDYETARAMDAETARSIEGLRPDRIQPERACGSHAVNGLLTMAAQRGWSVETVDLRNSGDTTGAKDEVVGYGAFVIS
ncbi:MAG TPA: AmmeMemoRadiSam system protein B [Nitrospiria bacterium]|nr:AmmeMemoRadiSam system protein B [Nitrospiria bacterium]